MGLLLLFMSAFYKDAKLYFNLHLKLSYFPQKALLCHLDISTLLHNNIIDNICDLYQRSNRVISDFRVCDSGALDSLH